MFSSYQGGKTSICNYQHKQSLHGYTLNVMEARTFLHSAILETDHRETPRTYTYFCALYNFQSCCQYSLSQTTTFSIHFFAPFVQTYLSYKSYFFSQRIVFFSHTKSVNNIFNHVLSAKQVQTNRAFIRPTTKPKVLFSYSLHPVRE